MTTPIYSAAADRYDSGMQYARCGSSGILLPRISLGMWQNFGDTSPFTRSREMILHAFDKGVVSIDLANNYGPPYGSAEETFGRVMRSDLAPYRDELFIATKAGYDMWEGPYGNWGSRKYLFASLHQSLRRMNLEYVDVFYSHRYDPDTPLEETLQALVDIVRQGKALYVGISRWPKDALAFADGYLRNRDVPCLLFQDKLNIFDRAPLASGVLEQANKSGMGFVSFSPLAQGLLTNRYLHGVPQDSRAARGSHLASSQITPELVAKISALNDLASQRGESLANMALSWVLAHREVTSVIVGCSSTAQLDDSLNTLSSPALSAEEMAVIDQIVGA